MKRSDVRYARSADGIDIAYQFVGEGPIDVVFVPGFISHLDLMWEIPAMAARYEALARGMRMLTFDKRGTGLSDRSLGFGSVAERMDDIRAVMDAAGIERAGLMGVSEGGPLALVFAATYPDRVTKLALFGTYARAKWAEDYPTGASDESSERFYSRIRERWGSGDMLRWVTPDAPEDATPVLARYERSACTPHMVEEIMRKNGDIDVRDILPTISTPALVLHNSGDSVAKVEWGRYLAEHIPGATYHEIDSDLHGSWYADNFPYKEVRDFFLGEAVATPDPDRMLATVLFTDIVSSTERAAIVGDRAWRDLLGRHDEILKDQVERYRGKLIATTGDGVVATFDGPGRAIECVQATMRALTPFGIDIRAGVHTGEIEVTHDNISGIGVVIARRICDTAASGEVLTSRTVKDLVVGSGIMFDDRGVRSLKGVPDDWQLFAAK
jgi:pimeloyl-ACP methyl ester carboxylesterase/class 3 adenylate cyclase